MLRLYTLFILGILATACMAVPFWIGRQLPPVLKRISQLDDGDDIFLVVPQVRERRSQPIIDYTDEFSADPFEMPLNKGRRP
ncbi:hypothetical protein RB195_019198 [Necator americanus]|uniref:Uncharacterized protein n=1 Tax=Necator americanus TaxID=51031 RepID=A0ABR1CD30_NECAM